MEELPIVEKKTTYTPALKKAIYKWRETHTEHFRDYSNKWSLQNYYKNAEKYKETARTKYKEKQEALGLPIRPRGRPKKSNKELEINEPISDTLEKII